MLGKLVRNVALKNSSLVGKVAQVLNVRFRPPIFIVGTGRCGTSLLLRILRSHPNLAIYPDEANELWHPKLYPFEAAQVESPPIEIDPQAFTELSLAHWPRNHQDKIVQTFNGFNMMKGMNRTLVVKSAMISFMIPKIKNIFSDARFIHIYRYGPSVIESYFKKNFGKYSRYHYTEDEYYRACAKYWNSCILRIEEDRQLIASSNGASVFLELSYESLCNDPANVLKTLSNFLDIESERYTFDLSTIRNTNYKVDGIVMDRLKPLIDHEMLPAMKLKGYLV